MSGTKREAGLKSLMSLLLIFMMLTASAQQRRPELGRQRYTEGRFAGFAISPTEHIIEEVEPPLVVRKVAGILRSQGGEWPKSCEILFEIRGLSPATAVKGVLADSRGRFSLRGMSPGTYVFKATANGWQSVVGTLIVSESAKDKEIDLTLRLGV